MLICLNGRILPEEQALVSVYDRGFLYGDGLFETLRVFHGKPFRWTQHMERLQQGADFLKIRLPFAAARLRDAADQLILKNQMPDALLRLTVSRGVGRRGYSPAGAVSPTVVLMLHPAPEAQGPRSPGQGDQSGSAGPDASEPLRWKLITSSCRLPAGERLAQFKTCNKLAQILARAEADAANADEALLLNTDGHVVEGSSSNLFWIDGNTVCTPPLASGILAGVTRSVVLEICRSLGWPVREGQITPARLPVQAGVFLSLSSLGVIEAGSLDAQALSLSSLTDTLRRAYTDLLRSECG
jgi:branched-chain amino acid aminotransferase